MVIVALHWGLEYDHEPISDQVSVAKALWPTTTSPHLRPPRPRRAAVRRRARQWVAYGLGNAIAQQDTPRKASTKGSHRASRSPSTHGRFRVFKAEYIPTYISAYNGADPRMR